MTPDQVKNASDRAEGVQKDGAGKPGRPSKISAEIIDHICEKIADGMSLRAICEDDTMPHRITVMRWLDDNRDFATKYARARELQGDAMDEKILSVADECTNENAQAARVKIDAYKWRASKLAPKKYGDKVQQEISGPDGGPIETKTDDMDVARRVAFLLSKAAKE